MRQRNVTPSLRCALLGEVNRHSSQSNPADARPRTPKDGADAREELFRIERLGDVVISAESQSLQLLIPLRTSRENDDRNLAQRPQDWQHLESVVVRQCEIEDDQVRSGGAGTADGACAVGGNIHLVPFGLEVVSKDEAQGRVVFNDENPVRHGRQHTGSPMTQRVPIPSALSTVSVPPWSAITLLAIASPSPPPSVGAKARLAMLSRTAASFFAEMPHPLSCTSMKAVGPTFRMATRIRPSLPPSVPLRAWRSALSIRFFSASTMA